MDEIESLLKRTKAAMSAGGLSERDYDNLEALVETAVYLSQAVENKAATIERLRAMLFGSTSEKTRDVLKPAAPQADPAPAAESPTSADGREQARRKRKGHGRNGADAYAGAERVAVPHTALTPRQLCPDCGKGKLYALPKPARIVRIVGQAPLQAKVYELDRLRCNLCGEVFTAPAPEAVGSEKYDASAASMIALLRYGSGLPFKRLEGLQGGLGVPLPTSTQWDIVQSTADELEPVYEELIRQAAQGEILHNDDTWMTVLELTPQRRSELFAEDGARQHAPERTGVFTSGVVSTAEDRKITLFFTGCKHAGENITDLLNGRLSELSPPIQMCDGLKHNLPRELEVIAANCLIHGRRKFVEVVANFPEECRYVLEILAEVYKHDAQAAEQGLSPEERLSYHQTHSGPLMDKLNKWLTVQFKQRHVEPNSGLGNAISYMLNHWEPLTLFLREPGAPLDNNVCERALKKAILHRKNSLFYKTRNGARVGDLFMSLIHTCLLNDAEPFDYLTELQRHAREASDAPQGWMPWNYRQTLEDRAAPTD